MHKLPCTFVAILLSASAFSQITTTAAKPVAKPSVDNTAYDSTENFLGSDGLKYAGQELYVKCVSEESFVKGGYDGFYTDFNDPIRTKYKKGSSYYTPEEFLVGKYFTVLETFKHPETEKKEYLYGKKIIFKLKEKETGEILYYEFDTVYASQFPFVVVGYFEKQKQLAVGKDLVLADFLLKEKKDINTGKPIAKSTGQVWKCNDLTIDAENCELSLLLQNSSGEKIAVSVDDALGNKRKRCYTVEEAEACKKKYGAGTFKLILEGNVKMGMSKEACRLACGEPKEIVRSNSANTSSEMWVYANFYLHFDNGKLTALNDR